MDGSSVRAANDDETDVAQVGFTAETDWAPPQSQSYLWSQRGSVSVFASDAILVPSNLDVRSAINEVCVRVSLGLQLQSLWRIPTAAVS